MAVCRYPYLLHPLLQQGENVVLDTGDELPEFTAEASTGKIISKDSLRGSWAVLYFYPKDDTPGCTRQACSFRDYHRKIEALGATVYGCSPDDLKAHDRFINRHDIPFPLISDPERIIAKLFGVWREKNMYGKKVMGIERSTFLINPEGIVHRVWRKVKVDGHVDDILDELRLVSQ